MDERDTQQIINVQNLFIFVKNCYLIFMWMKIKIMTNLRTKIFYADTLYIILVPQESMLKSQKDHIITHFYRSFTLRKLST